MSSTLPHDHHDPCSSSTSDTSVLDASILQGLKDLGGDDDPGLFFELIDLFLQDAPTRMEEIQRGLDQGDIRLLERAAHTLKSSSANIGALTLSELCRSMEERARHNENVGLAELFDRSRQLWPRVEAALRAAKS